MSNFSWDAQQNPAENPSQMGMFGPLGMVPSANRPITERPQVVPSRPLTDRPMTSFGPASRPNMNDEIRRTLAATRERRQQRRRIIGMLVLAHILVLLAVAPGYLSPQIMIAPLAFLGAAIVMDLLALAASRLFNNDTSAAYILVIGGGLVAVAFTVFTALTPSTDRVLQTGFASFLLVIPVLEAGLLLSPELTLVIAAIGAAVTAASVMLALALSGASLNPSAVAAIYQTTVTPLVVLGMGGLIAWLLAVFIEESARDAQRSQEQKIALAQLDATTIRIAQQQERINQSVRELQSAIGRVLTGGYSTRVQIIDGELADLMRSFNLLLNQFEAMLNSDQMRGDNSDFIRQILEIISRMPDGVGFPPILGQPPVNSPLNSVIVALGHVQAQYSQRLARLSQMAQGVVGAASHGAEGLSNITGEMTNVKQIAGALVNATNNMLPEVRSAHQAAAQARAVIGASLPEDLRQTLDGPEPDRDMSVDGLDVGGQELEGLGYDIIGATGEYSALEPPNGDEAHIAPLTVKVDALDESGKEAESEGKSKGRRKRGAEAQTAPETPAPNSGSAPQQLVDLYQLLGQLTKNLAQEYRSLRVASRELGRLSRGLRNIEGGVVFGVGSLDATREAAEDLQMTSGTGQGPVAGEMRAPHVDSTSQPSYQEPVIEQQAAPESEAEPEGPATGSLNAADLLSPDLFTESMPPQQDDTTDA
jgi:methyl-accepting chemotaxis protein